MIHISARKPSLFVREVPYFFKLTGWNIIWRRWLLSEWEWSTVDGGTLLGENRRTPQKPVSVPLCSPQIQLGTGLGLCSMVDTNFGITFTVFLF